MAFPDGLTENERLVRSVAGLIDILRAVLVYEDRERALEKFYQLDRSFEKMFLAGQESSTPPTSGRF